MWLIAGFLVLGAISFGFIALGLVLLVRHAKELSAQGRIVFAGIPLGFIALSPLIGYASTFPFGLFLGIVGLAFVGESSHGWSMIVLGCLLNALGIFGVLSLFKRQLGLP
jgi:hypothetical protein